VKDAKSILKYEFENDEIDIVTYFEENYMVGKIRMMFRKKEAIGISLNCTVSTYSTV